MNNLSHKLVIGSVQFGMNYGINNDLGQTSKEEVFKILDYATKNNIENIDTSYLYGNSEEVLGVFKDINNFKIISKCPSIDKNIEKYFSESLEKLNQKNIYGYLIHHFDFFIKNPKIWDNLKYLKEKGVVKKIGFSVYYPHEVELLLEKNIEPDIIQIPYNIFDQRFKGILENKRYPNIEFYSRSVFLQGLFFKKINNLSDYFKDIKPKIKKLEEISKFSKKSISELCLKFVFQNDRISKVIIGIDNVSQLEDILSCIISNEKLEENTFNSLISIKEENEKIILPFNWPKI